MLGTFCLSWGLTQPVAPYTGTLDRYPPSCCEAVPPGQRLRGPAPHRAGHRRHFFLHSPLAEENSSARPWGPSDPGPALGSPRSTAMDVGRAGGSAGWTILGVLHSGLQELSAFCLPVRTGPDPQETPASPCTAGRMAQWTDPWAAGLHRGHVSSVASEPLCPCSVPLGRPCTLQCCRPPCLQWDRPVSPP